MQLYNLVDEDEMSWLFANGYLSEQFHPTEPLSILNYSKRAVPTSPCWEYESLWYCRGLIYNTDSGQIVARPFRKFWNYGDPHAAKIPLDAKVEVYDKVDGSLGIGYALPSTGELRIATRGSFTSEQAIEANKILDGKYPSVPTTLWYTPLFEIIYPENRIVVDNGDTRDLVLLGGIDMRNGDIHSPSFFSSDWDGPMAQRFEYLTLAGALKAEPRPNAEGLVVRSAFSDDMVKLKQADYVELHRIIFGLSEKVIWKHLRDNPGHLDELTDSLPEEFKDWVFKVAARILGQAALIEEAIRTEYNEIVWNIDWVEISESNLGDLETIRRANAKAFAAEAAKSTSNHKWALFLLFNGRGDQIRQTLLEKHLEPMGRTGMSPADRDQED